MKEIVFEAEIFHDPKHQLLDQRIERMGRTSRDILVSRNQSRKLVNMGRFSWEMSENG